MKPVSPLDALLKEAEEYIREYGRCEVVSSLAAALRAADAARQQVRAATLREVTVEAKGRAAFSSVDGQDILLGLADWCSRQVKP